MDITKDFDRVFAEALAGERHIFFAGKFLVIRHPTARILYRADSIYEHWLEVFRDEGLMERKELYEHLRTEGSWTEEDDAKMVEIAQKIISLETKMEDEKFSSQKYVLQKRHKELIVDYGALLDYKNKLFALCAEEMAERKKVAFLIAETVEENGALLWGSIDRIENEDDWDLLVFCEVAVKYIFNRYDIATLRKIARSAEFRMRWNAAKKIGAAFFEAPPCLWNPVQASLLAWANFYDQVYEDTQRPEEHVIDDDEELDKWWSSRINDLERDRKDYLAKKGITQYKGKLNAMKHDEVIVVGEAREKYKDLITDSAKKRKLMLKGKDQIGVKGEEIDRPSVQARMNIAKGKRR